MTQEKYDYWNKVIDDTFQDYEIQSSVQIVELTDFEKLEKSMKLHRTIIEDRTIIALNAIKLVITQEEPLQFEAKFKEGVILTEQEIKEKFTDFTKPIDNNLIESVKQVYSDFYKLLIAKIDQKIEKRIKYLENE